MRWSLCVQKDQNGVHASAERELGAHRGGLGLSRSAATSDGSSRSCSFWAVVAMAKGTPPSNCWVAMGSGRAVVGGERMTTPSVPRYLSSVAC